MFAFIYVFLILIFVCQSSFVSIITDLFVVCQLSHHLSVAGLCQFIRCHSVFISNILLFCLLISSINS